MSELSELKEYERQLLEAIERGGTRLPRLPNPILDRAINPDDYDMDDEDYP